MPIGLGDLLNGKLFLIFTFFLLVTKHHTYVYRKHNKIIVINIKNILVRCLMQRKINENFYKLIHTETFFILKIRFSILHEKKNIFVDQMLLTIFYFEMKIFMGSVAERSKALV